MTTAQTAPTQYITSSTTSVKYAYRKLGPWSSSTKTPLVMHCHFRSNMDFWDPLLLNSLAQQRPVLIFENAGVGRSTGEVPLTFQGWADHVIALVDALGINHIDLLGFSMGGCVVQMVALTAPQLVRKLIIAGSSASAPKNADDLNRTAVNQRFINTLSTAMTPEEVAYAMEMSFFYETDEGRAAGKAFWARTFERTVEPRPDILGKEATQRQLTARKEFFTYNPHNSFDRLGELEMPVFVCNGDNDVLIPPDRSWEMLVRIPHAHLHIYPNAGHGFLYQYAELFAAHVGQFLDDFGGVVAKL